MATSLTDDIQHILIQLDEPINLEQVCGEGCYGQVHQVKFNGAPCIAKKLHDILKTIPQNSLPQKGEQNTVVKRFYQECIVLSQMRHPNVVQFIGVYQLNDNIRDIALVMEQLHTDLKHFIEDYNELLTAPIKEPGDVFTNSNDFYLPLKLSITHDIICGLLHIHSHKVLHRDLNAGNVLLTRNFQAKVADLGVARSITPSFSLGKGLTKCPGAPDCMPPEALKDTPVYENSLDVFSLGHVMLHLVSCKYPTPRDPVYDEDTPSDKIKPSRCSLCLGYQAQKRIESLNRIGDDHCTIESIITCLSDNHKNRPSLDVLEKEYALMCSNHPIPQHMIFYFKNKIDVDIYEECQKLREEKAKLVKASIQERYLATEKDKELLTHREKLEALQQEYDKTSVALEQSEAKLQQLRNLLPVEENNTTLSYTRESDGATNPMTEDERVQYDKTIKSLRSVMEQAIMENEELRIKKKKGEERMRTQSEPGIKKSGFVNFVKKRVTKTKRGHHSDKEDGEKEDLEDDYKSEDKDSN